MNSTFYGGGLLCALATGVCYVLTSTPSGELQELKAGEKESAVAD
jgi:hypothetical protein